MNQRLTCQWSKTLWFCNSQESFVTFIGICIAFVLHISSIIYDISTCRLGRSIGYQLRLTNQRRPRRFILHACARFVLFALTFAERTTFEHLSWIFRPDLVCWSVYTSKNEIVRVVDGCPRRHGVLWGRNYRRRECFGVNEGQLWRRFSQTQSHFSWIL